MKKILTLAAVAAFAVAFTVSSCTKKNDNPTGNYTCTCISTIGGSNDTTVIPENNIAKNTAQSACTSEQTNATASGVPTTCTFK
jgi:hypothetical protein